MASYNIYMVVCSKFSSTLFCYYHVSQNIRHTQTMRYSKILQGKFAETNILITIEAHSDHKMWENFILHFPRVKSMSYGL